MLIKFLFLHNITFVFLLFIFVGRVLYNLNWTRHANDRHLDGKK